MSQSVPVSVSAHCVCVSVCVCVCVLEMALMPTHGVYRLIGAVVKLRSANLSTVLRCAAVLLTAGVYTSVGLASIGGSESLSCCCAVPSCTLLCCSLLYCRCSELNWTELN